MSEGILVAMSGGVDSAAAAALLLAQGFTCAGANLCLFTSASAPPERSCGSPGDAEDARAAAEQLGIPFYVFDFSRQFEKEVISRFAGGYARGVTPNPCIDCNRFIKFAALEQQAVQLGYDAIATGHYARREADANGRWLLRRGADVNKDQSYVLAHLSQAQLAMARFPLGDMTKPQVRAYAAGLGLRNAEKRESQDICFVPGGDYGAFLERRAGQALCPGDFVDPEGNVLGRHRGTACYTIGQRKGLGLALPRPGYVCAIDTAENKVVVGDEARLFTRDLTARELNWIAFERLNAPLRCRAKVRYRQSAQRATAEQTGEDTLCLRFDEPQRAITPGQTVALYDEGGEYVLGAGIIDFRQ